MSYKQYQQQQHKNYYYMDNPKNGFGLLLKKYVLRDKIIELGDLSIYDIDDLTDDKLNILIHNFFENDNCDYVPIFKDPLSYRKRYLCTFDFGYKKYKVYFLGKGGDGKNEEKINKLKKIIIKFFNFLKNIMIQNFCYGPRCLNDDGNDDIIIHSIGDIIKNSKEIKQISFPGYYLKDSFLKILSGYVMNHSNLKCLYFGYSELKLSHINVKYIDDIIKSSNIENIFGLDNDTYSYLFESLLNNCFNNKNPTLQLQKRNINDELVFKISAMIKEKKIDHLMKIDLSCNEITSKGFLTLANSLLESNNINIIKINMSDNKLDDDCIKKLGELIKKNENIMDINFSRNGNITNKGIEELSDYIIGNTSIKSIKLYHYLVITDSLFEVIKHMIVSSYISSIGFYISANDEHMKEIEKLLKNPIEKREIPLMTIEDVKSASKKIMKE